MARLATRRARAGFSRALAQAACSQAVCGKPPSCAVPRTITRGPPSTSIARAAYNAYKRREAAIRVFMAVPTILPATAPNDGVARNEALALDGRDPRPVLGSSRAG